jgi:hypothetical protein
MNDKSSYAYLPERQINRLDQEAPRVAVFPPMSRNTVSGPVRIDGLTASDTLGLNNASTAETTQIVSSVSQEAGQVALEATVNGPVTVSETQTLLSPTTPETPPASQ